MSKEETGGEQVDHTDCVEESFDDAAARDQKLECSMCGESFSVVKLYWKGATYCSTHGMPVQVVPVCGGCVVFIENTLEMVATVMGGFKDSVDIMLGKKPKTND